MHIQYHIISGTNDHDTSLIEWVRHGTSRVIALYLTLFHSWLAHRPKRWGNRSLNAHELNFQGIVSMVIVLKSPWKWVDYLICSIKRGVRGVSSAISQFLGGHMCAKIICVHKYIHKYGTRFPVGKHKALVGSNFLVIKIENQNTIASLTLLLLNGSCPPEKEFFTTQEREGIVWPNFLVVCHKHKK